MTHCPNCGTPVDRREIDPQKALPCPACDHPLHAALIADTPIHECSHCGGLWLDPETFHQVSADREHQEKALTFPPVAALNESGTKSSPSIGQRLYRPCPICGELMNRKNFAGCSGVIVDLCKQHGIWFDHQELQKIIAFIQDGGLRKAREIEKESLIAEQKRLQTLKQEQSLGVMASIDHPLARRRSAEGDLVDLLSDWIGKLF